MTRSALRLSPCRIERSEKDWSLSSITISLAALPPSLRLPNLPVPSYRRRDEAHIKMIKFYLDIMQRRRESGSFQEEGHDMLQALQGAAYKDGRAVTDKEIAHMMIALLMTGQHTSAATTSCT